MCFLKSEVCQKYKHQMHRSSRLELASNICVRPPLVTNHSQMTWRHCSSHRDRPIIYYYYEIYIARWIAWNMNLSAVMAMNHHHHHHHHPWISADTSLQKLQGRCVSHISQCCCGRWCASPYDRRNSSVFNARLNVCNDDSDVIAGGSLFQS